MCMTHLFRFASALLFAFLWFACVAIAQTETATVSGLITDETGAVVPGAEVKLQSLDRGTVATATTNDAGIYVFASVHPGQYQVTVHKPGFKQVDLLGMIVNVQDHIEQNFRLQIGSVAESVTVNASDLHINTTDASVSTVVDRQFAENLPMNGRSFQTLIQLTPGVVLTVSTPGTEGQFSVNGQRASANYWTVDGVSANIGIGANGLQGNGSGGALPAFSAQGGTNSLVSVDAMQEFRIQTSTYAPEFGRTSGGQISIVTRSGTNQFHGTAFDFLRNDVLDANDWFANNKGLKKPEERQNDFGGTFSGPILKDRTFFFFSYEGLRLRLPQVALGSVPDAAARQSAIPATQPVLNAFPLPNGADNVSTGTAQLNASYSDSSTLDATSLRIDHRISGRLNLFGRYNYSPSQLTQRVFALSNIKSSHIGTHTATVGSTWMLSPFLANDLRVNYSRSDAESTFTLDTFGGAKPLDATAVPFPTPFTSQTSEFEYQISGGGEFIFVGRGAHNLQRQLNLVDNISIQRGSHSLKVGVDYRHLSPFFDPPGYEQQDVFRNNFALASGTLQRASLIASNNTGFILKNLGAFAQDTWRITPSVTLTFGLRWDVDFAPATSNGPNFAAVTNFDDLAKFALAPAGAPVFDTRYGNVAPRTGIAYQVSPIHGWQTVLRAGFGLFYDLATQELGTSLNPTYYPFGATSDVFGGQYPLSASAAAPPAISASQLSCCQVFTAFDPKLDSPYTLHWNVAWEQALGTKQSLTTSYIGAVGRRLIATEQILTPNPNFVFVQLIRGGGTSDYNSLQLQFQRRLSSGLQALASYSWAHSIDTDSSGAYAGSAIFVRQFGLNVNRGPSDFDVRHAFSTAITYDIPSHPSNRVLGAALHGWSVQNVFQARSAPPVTVFSASAFLPNFSAFARPDIVPGVSLYLSESQCVAVNGPPCAGGKGFNPAAFTDPPSDPNTGAVLRQGNLGRNALRGFGAWQWDFAAHRDFPIRESVKLQFRAEMFNVLNHPNFGPPNSIIGFPNFGQSTQMLGQSLNFGNQGGGGFSPLYQIGGPRSVQMALKLIF